MFKGMGMVAAMIAAMGGQPISGRTQYVTPQSDASQKLHLERAAAKRARKAEVLKRMAKRGAIGRVVQTVVEPPKPAKKPRARKTIGAVVE